jgi:oxygen-independent coproporphyrinogen-3 oxidase
MRSTLGESREVSPPWRAFECLLNGLRLVSGISETDFEARTGLAITSIDESLEAARKRGLLISAEGSIRPSALGMRFLSDLQAMFLPPSVGH